MNAVILLHVIQLLPASALILNYIPFLNSRFSNLSVFTLSRAPKGNFWNLSENGFLRAGCHSVTQSNLQLHNTGWRLVQLDAYVLVTLWTQVIRRQYITDILIDINFNMTSQLLVYTRVMTASFDAVNGTRIVESQLTSRVDVTADVTRRRLCRAGEFGHVVVDVSDVDCDVSGACKLVGSTVIRSYNHELVLALVLAITQTVNGYKALLR